MKTEPTTILTPAPVKNKPFLSNEEMIDAMAHDRVALNRGALAVIANESPLKRALREREADPQGKCGTCGFAQGFDNQFEIDKSIQDTCVRCTSRDKAIRTDYHNMEGKKNQDQLSQHGFFRIWRIEAMGCLYCSCWKAKEEYNAQT